MGTTKSMDITRPVLKNQKKLQGIASKAYGKLS